MLRPPLRFGLYATLLLRRSFMHDRVVLRTVDVQEADEAMLQARESMIDQNVLPGTIDLEVDDRSATRRNRNRLHADQWGRNNASE